MRFINNTSETGTILEELLEQETLLSHFNPEDVSALFHNLLLLSTVYDIVIDNGNIIFCDKE